METWDTEDGGPCFFRPARINHFDNPIYKTNKNNWPLKECIETNEKPQGKGRKVRVFLKNKSMNIQTLFYNGLGNPRHSCDK